MEQLPSQPVHMKRTQVCTAYFKHTARRIPVRTEDFGWRTAHEVCRDVDAVAMGIIGEGVGPIPSWGRRLKLLSHSTPRAVHGAAFSFSFGTQHHNRSCA